MEQPTADVSVRLAWPTDATAIAETQVAAWRATYGGLLPPDLLESLSADQFAAAWQGSIERPREARQRVLVALARARLCGFTTTSPSQDEDADPGRDAEVGEIVVGPSSRHQGHGSRLLHAAVDTMRADRFRRATTWVAASNDDLRAFLTAQGWAADGAFRELDQAGDGVVTVKQVRLHTGLTDD